MKRVFVIELPLEEEEEKKKKDSACIAPMCPAAEEVKVRFTKCACHLAHYSRKRISRSRRALAHRNS